MGEWNQGDLASDGPQNLPGCLRPLLQARKSHLSARGADLGEQGPGLSLHLLPVPETCKASAWAAGGGRATSAADPSGGKPQPPPKENLAAVATSGSQH